MISALVTGGSAEEEKRPTGTSQEAIATFAGGCFWCMQPPYDKLKGVISTMVGYAGGHKVNPTYKEVSSGETGHTEAIRIVYDPEKVTYEELLELFWHNIDPTTSNRQFCDWGNQYRPEIFYHDETQKQLAEQSKAALEETKSFEEPIRTKMSEAAEFYAAEDYHQKYYRKNPRRYKAYREGCGRDQRLEQLWGKKKK